jgi:anti-sigma factor RsiW
MGMKHRLHMAMGRARRLAPYAAGELPPADRARVEAELERCPACRREVEAYSLMSRALRTSARVALTPGEASVFWPAVENRIRRGAVALSRPARPGFRELVWDHPRLSLVSAVAVVVLVVGLALGQNIWGPAALPNGVEVISLEAGDDAPVMLFQAPGSSLKVIWVFEKPSPS